MMINDNVEALPAELPVMSRLGIQQGPFGGFRTSIITEIVIIQYFSLKIALAVTTEGFIRSSYAASPLRTAAASS
jgi:hypothetical protein